MSCAHSHWFSLQFPAFQITDPLISGYDNGNGSSNICSLFVILHNIFYAAVSYLQLTGNTLHWGETKGSCGYSSDMQNREIYTTWGSKIRFSSYVKILESLPAFRSAYYYFELKTWVPHTSGLWASIHMALTIDLCLCLAVGSLWSSSLALKLASRCGCWTLHWICGPLILLFSSAGTV